MIFCLCVFVPTTEFVPHKQIAKVYKRDQSESKGSAMDRIMKNPKSEVGLLVPTGLPGGSGFCTAERKKLYCRRKRKEDIDVS